MIYFPNLNDNPGHIIFAQQFTITDRKTNYIPGQKMFTTGSKILITELDYVSILVMRCARELTPQRQLQIMVHVFLICTSKMFPQLLMKENQSKLGEALLIIFHY